MKTRTEVYKERTEKERNKFSILTSSAILGVILMVYGFSSLIEDIGSNVSCDGKLNCLIFNLGSIFLVFLGLFLIWCLIFWFMYENSKYRLEKETTK